MSDIYTVSGLSYADDMFALHHKQREALLEEIHSEFSAYGLDALCMMSAPYFLLCGVACLQSMCQRGGGPSSGSQGATTGRIIIHSRRG